MVLGFFSFSKFLMYRDLDPENWPAQASIADHSLITAILRDGFPENAPLVPDDAAIDDAIPPLQSHHVVDADSSQTVVIAEAAAGRTMVVKGPPGTGKSQTITNIIAAAAARGRKVLFVAEKMAALDVVHRRLKQAGLGPLALELHSNKVNKRTVLDELKRTRDSQNSAPRSNLTVAQKLGDAIDSLNQHAVRMHAPLQPCGLSPYQILGRLAQAQTFGVNDQYDLVGAERWSPREYEECVQLAAELEERLAALGPVPEHKWRGVGCEALDPDERTNLGTRIDKLQQLLATALPQATLASDLLSAPMPLTIGDLQLSESYLAVGNCPPSVDLSILSHRAWVSELDALSTLVKAGEALHHARQGITGIFNPVGIDADYTSIRMAVATKGASLFRFLNSNYRAQIALLRSYLVGPLPKAQSERLRLIDAVIGAQKAQQALGSIATLGEAFGKHWTNEDSNWEELKAILTWRQSHSALPTSVWPTLAHISNPGELKAAHETLMSTLQQFWPEFEKLTSQLQYDLKRGFGTTTASNIPLNAMMERLDAWQSDLEGITRFIAFASRARLLAARGAVALVDAIYDGGLGSKTLSLAFKKAYSDVLRSVLFSQWKELKAFDGDTQNQLVKQFRELDLMNIELTKEQIAAAHGEGRPRGASGIGPLGVLNAELAKKRGHLPIRVLLDKAGPAIQQLKPVFMMSPLSVAQFLKPGGIQFDLLVMDEASQIEPVDALGAIARAKQIVVVGDERQLPPTSFFKKLTGDDTEKETDDNVTIQAKDAESILELCLAKGAPARMLQWHYRSKHQSLIAVSNREFYENKLFIVPSPYDAVAGMGLKFNYLKDAPYDRGGTRTNPGEARTIAEAVIRHARTCPDQSLGVATFSVAQRQLVLKELELLRRANPDTESFFESTGFEPFFVKNLDNIQGDERDVIFISVGYGKNEQGYLAHAFGPLSGEGGERRLNVLISRAKLRCEVFCNFTGADIDLDRTRARGVAALKLFLTFAETGHFGLGEATGNDYDSEFERQVCERLRSLGYDVKTQIGASGFRVDLAVSDPNKPGRFVLGIECDGAQYHSSRSARDRDRLRQQVLEAHGWIIHRIWSTDWYLRPQEELKKVEAAIASAKAEWEARDEELVKPQRAVPISFEGERIDDTDYVTATVQTYSGVQEKRYLPYVEADIVVDRTTEPHEVPIGKMADYISSIVQIEGPIHIDELTTRIRSVWGFARAGSRIRNAVEKAAKVATGRSLVCENDFYSVPSQEVSIRDRSQVRSPTLRKPEMLPPAEIDKAILEIVTENYGATQAQLIQAVSRALGFSATSSQLKEVIAYRISSNVVTGKLVAKDDLLLNSQAAVQ
jgi:very-short-patch-repair endonuclease